MKALDVQFGVLILFLMCSTHAAQPDVLHTIRAIPPNQSQIPSTIDKLLRDAVDLCQAHAAFVESLKSVPVRRTIQDSLELTVRCVGQDDARLRVRQRDASALESRSLSIEWPQPLTNVSLFGWDMTYGVAFDAAAASPADTMRKFYKDTWYRAPYAAKAAIDPALFEGVDDRSAEVAVLLDTNTLYGRGILFFISTGSIAEIRMFGGRKKQVKSTTVDASRVRILAEALMGFEPFAPESVLLRQFGFDDFVRSGYLGVVSVYLDGRKRQFPINERDNFVADDATGKMVDGRLTRILTETLRGVEEP
jgi:hypothetical protein